VWVRERVCVCLCVKVFVGVLRSISSTWVQIPKAQMKLTTWLNFCAFGIFRCKSCSYSIGEIDTRGQFHQHFTRAFFWYPFAIKSQSQTVIREKLHNSPLYKKRAYKMLVKLTQLDGFWLGNSKHIVIHCFSML